MEQDNYERLKEQLIKTSKWPSVYMFKFIVPADNRKIALVEGLFNKHAEFQTTDSKNGKYTSVTIKTVMENPDKVIEKYKEASKIEGIISL